MWQTTTFSFIFYPNPYQTFINCFHFIYSSSTQLLSLTLLFYSTYWVWTVKCYQLYSKNQSAFIMESFHRVTLVLESVMHINYYFNYFNCYTFSSPCEETCSSHLPKSFLFPPSWSFLFRFLETKTFLFNLIVPSST